MDSSLRMRSSAASNEQQSEAGHKQLESPAARQELDKRRDLSEMVWGAKAGCRFGGRAIVCSDAAGLSGLKSCQELPTLQKDLDSKSGGRTIVMNSCKAVHVQLNPEALHGRI